MSHNEAIELGAYAEIDTCKLGNHEHKPSCNRVPVITLNFDFASFFRKPKKLLFVVGGWHRRSRWLWSPTRMQIDTARRLCCEATNRPSY